MQWCVGAQWVCQWCGSKVTILFLSSPAPHAPSSAMTDIIRTGLAKSSNGWIRHDLESFNIQVAEQSFAEFFNLNKLPPVPPAFRHFCKTTDRRLAPDDNTYKLLHHLDLAENPLTDMEAVVDDFIARLLEMLGYASGHRVILTHQALPFSICGTRCKAQMDVSICDENDYYLLLVREDNSSWLQDRQDLDPDLEPPFIEDPEPPLIANAIAAYQQNNFIRERAPNVPTLSEMTFLGITLVENFPTFYKIKVTAELEYAVAAGFFPTTATIVYRHTPPLQLKHLSFFGLHNRGMAPLKNRTAAIRYYEAFKAFV